MTDITPLAERIAWALNRRELEVREDGEVLDLDKAARLIAGLVALNWHEDGRTKSIDEIEAEMEDDADLAAAQEVIAAIRRGEDVPVAWEQVKRELGLEQ